MASPAEPLVQDRVRPAAGDGPRTTTAITVEAAALLAGVHATRPPALPVRGWAEQISSLRRSAADLEGTRLAPSFAAVTRRLGALRVPDAEPASCVGDFGPHHLRGGPGSLRLVSPQRTHPADPLGDVASWGCWAWARLLLVGREPDWEPGDAFLDAYAARRALGPIGTRLVAHRARGLLHLAHGWAVLRTRPAEARAAVDEARWLVSTAERRR
jgi:hypothetical protein